MVFDNLFAVLKKLLLIVLACTFAKTSVAQIQEQEADLKAAFIYNFTKYIEWDTAGNQNDFVISIIGASPVKKPLTEIAKINTVNNKKIIIRQIASPDEIGDCNILFIPQKNAFSLHEILDKAGKGVLTISEENGYAKEGTAFNFIIKNDKLKFESNPKAINAAGLKAGSQLLKLATIVN